MMKNESERLESEGKGSHVTESTRKGKGKG